MPLQKDVQLRDLSQVVLETKARLSEYSYEEVGLSEQFRAAYSSYVSKSGNNIEFGSTTAIITNANGQKIYAPNHWFIVASYAVPLAKEVMTYREFTEAIIEEGYATLKAVNPQKINEKKQIYQLLRSEEIKEAQDKALMIDSFRTVAISVLSKSGYSEEESFKFADYLLKFLTDAKWWLGGKGIERTNDYYVSPVLGVLNLVNASQSYVATITYAYVTNDALYDSLSTMTVEKSDETDKYGDIINHNLFGIHIKEKNDALSDEHPHVCIGWSAMGDLSDIDSKDALAARYDEHFDKVGIGRGQDIGQVWRFINDIKVGDYIIFAEPSEFHIGRIESEYFYDDSDNPNQSADYKSTRTVKWIKKNISRSILSSDLHNSLKTAMSIWAINDYKSAVAELLRGTYQKDEERTEVEETVELVFKTGIETPYERNRIVFGAPGTGKSYLLKEDVKKVTDSYNGTVVERVTFHPEYSYSQFVGTYKPTMIEAEPTVQLDADKKEILSILRNDALSAQEKYDLLYERFKDDGLTRLPILLGLYCDDSFKTKKQDGTEAIGDNSVERNHGRAIRPYVNVTENASKKSEIAYEYVPGPFMRMYVSALKSARNLMSQPHILIIEEINRAKVAAVFGDVFQLLDRDEDGVSEYDIQASEDIKKYLAKELGGSPKDYSRIRIPDNMFIWATMNSADQGVFPMDTAFKRRWNFEYLGIDENAEKIAGIGKIILEGSDETIEWNRLRKAINAKMSSSEFKINEDKLMGPFFLSKKAIASNENGMIINKKAFIDAFKSKVIMYLYEDAVKQGKHRFFDGCPDTGKYSAVCDAFDKIGTGIFGPTFREDFYDKED